MARVSTPPISPAMYRHFAAITLAVTVTLAIFADGESRQAMSDSIAERHREAELQQAQVARFGKPKLIQRRPTHDKGWTRIPGGGFDPTYGLPSDETGAYAQEAGAWPAASARRGQVPASYTPYGLTQAAWDAMSEEERAAYLRQHAAAQEPVSEEQRRRQVAGLMAASAARSGVAGGSGD